MTDFPVEVRKFTPEDCPAGTVIVNTAGNGAMLRVDAWHDSAADISGWEGTDPSVIGSKPPTETFAGHAGLYGVEVSVAILPAPVAEPAQQAAVLTMADVLNQNLPAVLGDTSTEDEEVVEEEPEPEPVSEASAAPVVVDETTIAHEPCEHAHPDADGCPEQDEEESVGPPTGKYEGWELAKKAWVYQQVYKADGVLNMTKLTVAAIKDQWPKLSPPDVEEKILGRIEELRADGYQIAYYNDNNVVIGDWPHAQPISLEQYLSDEPEPAAATTEPDTEPEAGVDLALCSPTPELEADFSLTYGDGDPFTLLLEDIGRAFLTCAERMQSAR